jgi:hypothetical protein
LRCHSARAIASTGSGERLRRELVRPVDLVLSATEKVDQGRLLRERNALKIERNRVLLILEEQRRGDREADHRLLDDLRETLAHDA